MAHDREAPSGRSHHPLRVLAVTNMWPTPARPARGIFVRDAVEALRERGVAVDVKVVADGRSRLDYLVANLRVARAVRRLRPDVLHVHYGLSLLSTLFVSRSVPRVVTFYGSDANVPWQRRVARICLGLRPVSRAICVSDNLARKLPPVDTVVVPNGVDFVTFTPRDRTEARERCGLPPSGQVVLFAAKPSNPVKDHPRYQRVVDALRASGLDLIEAHFDGRTGLDGIIDRYAAADVLLFTSRRGSEGSPTVVKEALAMNLPVVATDVGDVRERLDGVQPSEVVPWGATDRETDDALARAVRSVLSAARRSDGREKWSSLDSKVVAGCVESILLNAARRR